MYAVIESGGKQHRVQEGEVLQLEKLEAATGDTILGVIWVLFVWALLGNVLRLALAAGGVANPARSRIVAAAIVAVLGHWRPLKP